MGTNEFRSAECSQPQPRSKVISGVAMMVWARPPTRIARFQHDDGEAGLFQGMRRAEAGRARADDRDVDGRGEGHGLLFVMPVLRGSKSWRERLSPLG